jgi:hypothetical protein
VHLRVVPLTVRAGDLWDVGTATSTDAEAGMLNKVTRAEQPLTAAERSKLAELEGVIGQGEQWLMRVGVSLKVIRDEKLYRDEFNTFEAYCQSRWNFTKSRANQLIGATDVVEGLATIVAKGTPLPSNEGQARALKSVPEEDRPKVWEEASGNGKAPTAAAITTVAKRLAEPPPELDPQDDAGNPIPAKLRPAFDNVARFDNALQSLSEIASELNPLMGDANEVKPLPGGEFLAAQRQYLRSHLKNARETLKACRPYAVCPYCKGGKAKCEACRGVGYVPKQIFDEAPKEMRK